MADTYFDYVLSQCRTQSIESVCSVDSTRKALQERAAQGFNGCNNVTTDWRLLKVVSTCLQNPDIIANERLNEDAQTIFLRCKSFFLSDVEKGYGCYFDHLVELNWLFASIQNANETNQGIISLLIDPDKVLDALNSHLLGLYNSAIHDNNECVYIEEAIQARKKFCTGLYAFKYEESKYYLSLDFTISNLTNMKDELRDNSICKMALFYGLTATAALTDSIRRYSK